MIQDYINHIKQELATENALEHSYRPALKTLVESLSPNIRAVNEPARSLHGAPDFVFLNEKNNTLIRGYAETKDIYVSLDQVEKTEQLKRYLGYSNLVLTNYIEFRFFRNGEKYQTVVLATKEGNQLIPQEDNFEQLERELKAFLEQKPENITSAKRLAQIMGGKAARIRANVITYLQTESQKNEELLRIYNVMKKLLVHDLEIDKFADMYAQTLVYGLFVARYYDKSPDSFSRQEARDLIPASNSFLQHFFDHIVGPNFDKRLTYIVDELCEVFTVSDVLTIIQRHYNLFGESVDKDPIIHFYEDFLKEYDSKLRKQMGAYYTPVPVVDFIIRAVDEVLKTEFNLPDGLASTEKIDHQTIVQGKKGKVQLHKVQILDPAVGTATFLNETIKFIYKKFKGQEGLWQSYVDKELLPRIYGFELMMAPYTIAHLKLAMTLKEAGIDHFDRRLGVYLTNTLEEGVKVGHDLFSFGLAEAISEEAQSASIIKNERPIMVVMGNPPYSGESFNKGAYAMKLVGKYKFEPGGKDKLKERNPKWINDDYVKFIAFAEEMISKTGEGIVAMITNSSYLDNPTFRGMRWHLTKTFSSIYVLDLHGSVKKQDRGLDGSKDENVFDIQQGVSIIIAVKHKAKNKLADVYRADIRGRRKSKFEFLFSSTIKQIGWEKIRLNDSSYIFLNKDEKLEKEYINGIKISDLFLKNTLGFQTHRDSFAICNDREEVLKKLSDLQDESTSNESYEAKYSMTNKGSWQLSKSRDRLKNETNIDRLITSCSYRPYDYKWTYFDESFSDRPRILLKSQMLNRKNISIEVSRQIANVPWQHIFISDRPAESCLVSNRTKEGNYSLPLYFYTNSDQTTLNDIIRTPNLNIDLVKQLLSNIGNYEWINDHEMKKLYDNNAVSPLDILDYVYATLHSPLYREKYKEFLKSDFPHVPAAKNK